MATTAIYDATLRVAKRAQETAGCLDDCLEALVDASDLMTTVESLSRVCVGKANSLRDARQDEDAAAKWESIGHHLDELAGKC